MTSKAIYIIAKILRIVVGIPTVCLILACIIFPIIAHTFGVEEDKIKILNQEIPYSIENNILTIDNSSHYINTSTNIKEFVENHDNIFFIISIEYVLLCVTVLSAISVQTLHYLYKLYKNIYEEDTPFTINNERIIKKVAILLIIQLAMTKITALIYSIIAKVDLVIDFNITDIILLLVAISIVYMFKYGRMLQADSKAKIYGKVEE